MSKHANVKPVSPEVEAAVLDAYEPRWTLAQPPEPANVPPYRGSHRPAAIEDRRPYTPPTLRSVSIEDITEAAKKLRQIQKSLTFILKMCHRHRITDIEVRNRSPMGPLHRVHDFAIEVGQTVAQRVGSR